MSSVAVSVTLSPNQDYCCLAGHIYKLFKVVIPLFTVTYLSQPLIKLFMLIINSPVMSIMMIKLLVMDITLKELFSTKVWVLYRWKSDF